MGNYIIIFFMLIGSLAAAELPITLKKREPNWRAAIQETYPDGTPKKIIFYEPEKGGNGEVPVKIVENYPEGKIHTDRDIPDGASLTYTLDGKIVRYATYKNDLIDGSLFLFDDQGKLKTTYKVAHGVLEGPKTSYYPNGTVQEKAEYVSGNLHGKMERFFENGTKSALMYYERGLLNGDVIEYNLDGTIREKLIYIGGVQYNGLKIPTYQPKLSPAKPLIEEPYMTKMNEPESHVVLDGEYISAEKKLFYKNGKPHGPQMSYHPNGNLEALLTYNNGVLDGKKLLKSPEGDILEEATYKNGNLEGRYFLKRPNGQEVISNYQDNRLFGLYQIYHPPHPTFGRVKAFEAHYENGLVEGEAVEYNEAGTKITSTLYKNGKKEGLATLYYKDGKVKITATFKDDLQDGVTHKYFSSGTLEKEAHFLQGKRNGDEKTFYENGQIKTHYITRNDKLDGPAKEWSNDGTLIFEGNYCNGKKDGTFKKVGNPDIVYKMDERVQ